MKQWTRTDSWEGCFGDCQAPCSEKCLDKQIEEDGGFDSYAEMHDEWKAQRRKATPVFTGVIKYFPDALMEVARCSAAGNNQHHADKPLHWDRSKSGDELDALARHLIGAGTIDDDGVRHSAKVAWRALANLQKELERAGEAENSQYNQ